MGMITTTYILCSLWQSATVGLGLLIDRELFFLSSSFISFFFLIYGWNPCNCQREFHTPSDDRLNPCKNVSLKQKHEKIWASSISNETKEKPP